jgi:hypothetical protein
METSNHSQETNTKSCHQQGWDDGYNDRQFDCQYPVGTPEYEAYCEGFNEGSHNS